MNKITFVDPCGENPEDLVWSNLTHCDKICHINLFISSSIGWLKLNPTKNFYDLEKELRHRNFKMHLYAKPVQLKEGYTLIYPNMNKQTPIYECVYSCLQTPALALAPAPAVDENLKKAGILSISVKDTTNLTHSYYDLLANNKTKIVLSPVSDQEYINYTINELTKTYGVNPEHRVLGLTHNGWTIVGFIINEKIVSHIGYVIGYDQQIHVIYDL